MKPSEKATPPGPEAPALDPRLALLGEIGAILSLGRELPGESLLRQLEQADARAGLLRRVKEAAQAERDLRAMSGRVAELERHSETEIARLERIRNRIGAERDKLRDELDKAMAQIAELRDDRLCDADRCRLEADIRARDAAIIRLALLLPEWGGR